MRTVFHDPDANEIVEKDMSIEQIQVLRTVDSIYIDNDDYGLLDMNFDVNSNTVNVWLKNQ